VCRQHDHAVDKAKQPVGGVEFMVAQEDSFQEATE
jgi:hypothetical protein